MLASDQSQPLPLPWNELATTRDRQGSRAPKERRLKSQRNGPTSRLPPLPLTEKKWFRINKSVFETTRDPASRVHLTVNRTLRCTRRGRSACILLKILRIPCQAGS